MQEPSAYGADFAKRVGHRSSHRCNRLACEQLESLVLNGCTALTSGGIAKLARCSKLRYLHVGQTGVDDAALALLCANCELKELGLCACQQVSDQTMEIMLTCPTLEDIFVDGTSVSTADY